MTDTKNISKIYFRLLTSDEILKQSVVEVKTYDTYENGRPVKEGLFDPRMGIIEPREICITCKQMNDMCPGHFGHIHLARPIYNTLYMNIIQKILNVTCIKCGRLLVKPEIAKSVVLKGISKLLFLEKLISKNIKCDNCGFFPQPSFRLDTHKWIEIREPTVDLVLEVPDEPEPEPETDQESDQESETDDDDDDDDESSDSETEVDEPETEDEHKMPYIRYPNCGNAQQ